MEIVYNDQVAQEACAERRNILIDLIHANLGLVAAATVQSADVGVLVIDTGVGSLRVKEDLSGIA
jgi:hypothetical protein